MRILLVLIFPSEIAVGLPQISFFATVGILTGRPSSLGKTLLSGSAA